MSLREKFYWVKVSVELAKIIDDSIAVTKKGLPVIMNEVNYNTLKKEVARTCFLKGYSLDVYKALFVDRTFDDHLAEAMTAIA